MKKTKKVGGENRPARCFAYVPDPEKPDTWKLPIYHADGSVDQERLPKAYAALTSNYRGQSADVPASARAGVLAKIRSAYKKAGMDWPGKKAEAVDLFTEGEILDLREAEGENQERVWEVVLIRPGVTKNHTYYPESVLTKAVPLFEGARALARSDDAHSWNMDVSVKNIVGFYKGVEYREGALRGQLHILSDGAWLHDKMVEARNLGQKHLFGLSIVAGGTATIKKHKGREVRYVESIDRVASVDPVVNPAAGGRFVKLAAAESEQLKGELDMFKKLLELIEAKRPDLLKGKDLENITEAEVMELAAQAMLTEAELAEAKKPAREPEKKEPEKNPETLTEAEKRITEAERRWECRMLLSDKLAESKLPEVTQKRLRAIWNGKIFTEAELDQAIKDERDYLALFDKSGQVRGAGAAAQATLDVRDRKIAAIRGFFMREAQKVGDEVVAPYRSIRELYQDVTGDRYLTGRLSEAANLRQMVNFPVMGHFAESMISTTLADVLYDAMHKKMIADYRMPGMDQWRLLVSDIVPVNDFRNNYRGRMGGYSDLPDVAERGDYTALTSPGDEKAYYAITKRGGTEDITLEMIANDDVGAVRKIPERLALAAKSTLFNFVIGLMTSNPTCTYDNAPLFVSGHGNYSASGLGLSAASLNTIRIAMRNQTPYGQTNIPLGIVPRYLWVPNELEDLANKLCNSLANLISAGTTETSDMPNLHHGMTPVVMDIWTDADDYYVSGDRSNPMIELGFFMGREEPELFLQSAPEQGSMFLADKLTWKIRHIYGGHWLDHRNVYYSKV